MNHFKAIFAALFLHAALSGSQLCSQEASLINRNKPEREEWLKDAGFGMFIHWNIDVQLGTVISHSLAGASEAYIEKYIHELPATFNPVDWDPEKIVIQARNAGMKYIVFTTKHHNGFCFWDTESTDFNITNTPYGKDILADLVVACRKHGMAVGFYYSTEDFVFSYRNGIKHIRRRNHWEYAKPIHEPYKAYIRLQVNELMTRFGDVDFFFIDSEAYREEVKSLVWKLQPECVITRGAIPTPEQFIPGENIAGAWESNMTMGTQWNYKPTNEHYKSGTYLINALIRARARGGSFLLNVGPGQWGQLNEAQHGRLQELAAWNFVNGEAIQGVRPWIISNEGDLWLTQHKDQSALYIYITGSEQWKRGERKSFVLRSARITDSTTIGVLGQTGNVVEYMPHVDGRARVDQQGDSLCFSVVRAQRLYNNHRWPNPVVVKLENILPAIEPGRFLTLEAELKGTENVQFSSRVTNLGSGDEFWLFFEYRPLVSSLEAGEEQDWQRSGAVMITDPGEYHFLQSDRLFSSMEYDPAAATGTASSPRRGVEYRAVFVQDGLEIHGNILTLK